MELGENRWKDCEFKVNSVQPQVGARKLAHFGNSRRMTINHEADVAASTRPIAGRRWFGTHYSPSILPFGKAATASA